MIRHVLATIDSNGGFLHFHIGVPVMAEFFEDVGVEAEVDGIEGGSQDAVVDVVAYEVEFFDGVCFEEVH